MEVSQTNFSYNDRVAFLSCSGDVMLKLLRAVLPIYTNGPRAKRVPGVTFSRYTMSNLSPGSTLYW